MPPPLPLPFPSLPPPLSSVGASSEKKLSKKFQDYFGNTQTYRGKTSYPFAIFVQYIVIPDPQLYLTLFAPLGLHPKTLGCYQRHCTVKNRGVLRVLYYPTPNGGGCIGEDPFRKCSSQNYLRILYRLTYIYNHYRLFRYIQSVF